MPQKNIPERPTRMIHIRLSEGNHRKLKVEVAKKGLTIQEWVSQLIEGGLNKRQ